MFGSVPKAIWGKLISVDEKNRIPLCTRSLILESTDRKILVDAGCGDRWSEKARDIFQFESFQQGAVPGVTDVLLTHLHFDHAGGILTIDGAPRYPEAKHWLSRTNLENAKDPNVREKASYLPEIVSVFETCMNELLEDEDEPFPGITVHQVNGHTRGLQWVKVFDGGNVIAFPSDLFPTAHHLPVPYVMGYDICAETSIREREEFIKIASTNDWIVVFEHDRDNSCGRLERNEEGKISQQKVNIPEAHF